MTRGLLAIGCGLFVMLTGCASSVAESPPPPPSDVAETEGAESDRETSAPARGELTPRDEPATDFGTTEFEGQAQL